MAKEYSCSKANLIARLGQPTHYPPLFPESLYPGK